MGNKKTREINFARRYGMKESTIYKEIWDQKSRNTRESGSSVQLQQGQIQELCFGYPRFFVIILHHLATEFLVPAFDTTNQDEGFHASFANIVQVILHPPGRSGSPSYRASCTMSVKV